MGNRLGVTYMHKNSNRLIPSNYRPVSLTSVVCKIMQQIICDKIIDHLVNNDLLSSCQHGFIKGRSCITQLLATLDRWTEVMDGGGDVDAVYFSKCFDSVHHERLLMKIGKYGIQGKLWDWVVDFFRGRYQQVSIRGYLSAIAAVLSGIPQGSVLGPLLFIIFINEMLDMVHTCIQMFADDTKLFTHIKDESDVAWLQDDLDSLQSWADAWQLRFNPDKCKVLHLGQSNRRAKYNMSTTTGNQIELQSTDLKKDLGVWIDPSLTFCSHCESQAGKANRTLGLIRCTCRSRHIPGWSLRHQTIHIPSEMQDRIRISSMGTNVQKGLWTSRESTEVRNPSSTNPEGTLIRRPTTSAKPVKPLLQKGPRRPYWDLQTSQRNVYHHEPVHHTGTNTTRSNNQRA